MRKRQADVIDNDETHEIRRPAITRSTTFTLAACWWAVCYLKQENSAECH